MLVLKELYDLSDAQTADALAFDIRWKVACGRPLTQVSFDPSTLVYWRRRIAASDRPDRVFDTVAEVITQTGVLRGRRKRRVDSTVFDDAVAPQDTVTQLVAAMRKVARVVPGAAGVISRVWRLDYSRPGKPPIDWDDPAAKDALVSDLVNDALAVLAGWRARARPGTRRRRMRWACWRPWPGRMWSRRRILTGRAEVADRPQGRPGPGDQYRGPRGPAYPQEQVGTARRVPRPPGR